MKKKIKYLLILAIVIVVGAISFMYFYFSKKIKNRILPEFALSCKEEINEIIAFGPIFENADEYYLLSEDSLYLMLINNEKIFSNNDRCIKKSNYDKYSTSVDSIEILVDNTYYSLERDELEELRLCSKSGIKNNALSSTAVSDLYLDPNNYYTNKQYVVETDGNVYEKYPYGELIYTNDVCFDPAYTARNLVISNEKYGKIRAIYGGNDKPIEFMSENGYYVKQVINKEECNKYVDIKCIKDYALLDEYKDNSNNILYIDNKYVIDKNLNVYTRKNFKLKYKRSK